MTRHDKIIIAIIFVASSVIGGAITAFFMHKTADVSLPDNSKYIRQADSIAVINQHNIDTITVLKKHIQLTDSLSLLNFKKISHDKKAIDSFTPKSRKHYLDSLFKSAGI